MDINKNEAKVCYDTIGVCFVSNNEEVLFNLSDSSINPEEKGLYKTKIDINNIDNNTFDNYKFCPDVTEIQKNIKEGYTYTINVPNKKAYRIDQENKTGFEKDDNHIGTTQTGNTGAYYYRRKLYF